MPTRAALATLLLAARAARGASPWPPAASAAARAQVAQLSRAEKLALVAGVGGWPAAGYVGVAVGAPRVGAAPLALEDGPQGVADGVRGATAFPCALAVAATWDAGAALAFGAALGAEQHAKGANVLLGPDVNLARVPWGGRVFEAFGEDPALAGAIASAVVRGAQAANVSAVVKHLAENAFDAAVANVSMNVGRRAHKQLYMHAFCAAVDAGVGYAMCAYNRVNGTHACENAPLIADLKGAAGGGCGFAGALMSDWFATHSSLPAALAGLDLDMPGTDGWFNASALDLLPAARLDDMALRLLLPRAALELNADYPGAPGRNLSAPATSAAHAALARSLAQSATVLLRNDGALLPLSAAALHNVAVFGDNDTVVSGSSGRVLPPYVVTAAEGLARALPGARVTYADGRDAAAAAAAAAAADVAVVVVATSNIESADRAGLDLPAWQDALVAAVVAAQPRTVVVVRAPGAVAPPWLARGGGGGGPRAVLFEAMPGQESGNSIAALMLGVANPAGRLPISFPANVNDTWLSAVDGGPVDARRYPGTDRGRGFPEADFAEGLEMGYRYYDAKRRKPLFEFGFGLSYANFTLGDLRVAGGVGPGGARAAVRARVAHAGGPRGAAVAQLYARYPRACDEPLRLVAFARVELEPGAAADVALDVGEAELRVFDVRADAFALCAGAYELLLGASAADFRDSAALAVSA
jgi:beta-glucosidase